MDLTELQARAGTAVGVVGQLLAAAQTADWYKTQGDDEAAEAAKQTMNRALDRLDEHLAYFRGLCK